MAKTFIETQLDFVKSVKLKELKKGQKIGIIGAVVLLVGTFLPVMRLPYLGDISLYSSNYILALVVAISAIISGYLFLYPKIRYIIISNLIASVAIIYTFLTSWGQVLRYQSDIQNQFKGSPFGNYIYSALGTIEIKFLGWLVMLVGIGIIFYAVKSDLKDFYKEMKAKAAKVASDNRKSEVIEVEPEQKKEEKQEEK